MLRPRETHFNLYRTYWPQYLVIMVDLSIGWKALKVLFLVLAFLITLKRFDTIKGSFTGQKKIIIWIYVSEGKITLFYFQREYIPTVKEYYNIAITDADAQQFTQFGSRSQHEHIQEKQTCF